MLNQLINYGTRYINIKMRYLKQGECCFIHNDFLLDIIFFLFWDKNKVNGVMQVYFCEFSKQ